MVGDSISWNYSLAINAEILAEIGRAVTNEKPAFVLFGGDYAFSPSPTNYQLWTNLLSPVYQAGIPIYPALGNHDLTDVGAFTNMFSEIIPDNGPTEELNLTYAFAWSNALVLVLDVYSPSNNLRVNQSWVDAVLATNTLPHVFALAHPPAFKEYHVDTLDVFPAERDRFWNSLSNAQCRVYFCGHDHFYDHARIDDNDGDPQNDLHQIIVGTAGAPFYGDSPYNGTNSIWTPRRIFHEAQYGYVRVEIDGERGQTTWMHRTGTNTYEPGGDVFAWSIVRLPFLSVRQEGGSIVLWWKSDAVLQTTSEPGASFIDLPGATSPYTLTSVGVTARFFRLRSR